MAQAGLSVLKEVTATSRDHALAAKEVERDRAATEHGNGEDARHDP